MYNYTAPPSGYEYYRYKTKDSAKHPPYGYNSHYCTTSLDAQQPRRHSYSTSTSSYGHYFTSSLNSYNHYPPPYQSTENYTPERCSSKESPSPPSTAFNSSPTTQRPTSQKHYIPTSTSSELSDGIKRYWPTAPRHNDNTKKLGESTQSIKTDIPAGCSLSKWDPTDEPLLLLGSVLDAKSLRNWIYNWAPVTLKELTGDLSLQPIQQAGKTKVLRITLARLAGLEKLLRVLCLGNFFQVASALPIDPGESMNNPGWPGGPGLPSISGWPSPGLGLIFAAAVTHFSKPHRTSRMPGAMALVFNYLSLVASGDAQTPLAVLWTLKGLATYFIVFYGDVTFRKFQMGQGYFALLIFLGLIMNYCVTQILQTGKAEASLLDELFRFSLPTFSLSLCLCAYHAHYKQRAAEDLAHARLEGRLQIEERLRRENAVSQDGNAQPPQTTQSS